MCRGCVFDNTGPARTVTGYTCLHPESDLDRFWDAPESSCYATVKPVEQPDTRAGRVLTR